MIKFLLHLEIEVPVIISSQGTVSPNSFNFRQMYLLKAVFRIAPINKRWHNNLLTDGLPSPLIKKFD